MFNNDAWELLEAKEFHSKINSDFYEILSSSKWQERKQQLELLLELLDGCKRLAEDSRNKQMIEKLVKVLGSDSNIYCAALAAKCLCSIAQGLRFGFAPYATALAPICFNKFKEKKVILKEPLSLLVDALFFASIKNLSALSQSILEAANSPNPSQKSLLDLSLCRLFRSLPSKCLPKEMIKDLVSVLCQHCLGSDPELRDSSCAALGAFQKCVGEQTLTMFLDKSVINDERKMAKIREYKVKAEEEDIELRKKAALFSPSFDNLSNKSEHSSNEQLNGKENDDWELLDPKEIHSKIKPSFYELSLSEKWQDRKTALNDLFTLLSDFKRISEDPRDRQLIVKLGKILGSDSNIYCAALAASCLCSIAQGLRFGFAPYATALAPICFNKFKEKKVILKEPLSLLVDALFFASIKNLSALSQSILEAANSPNPSQKSLLDLSLYRLFRSLPSKYLPKEMIKDLVSVLCQHCLGSDPELRDSSCAALGAFKKCVGEQTLTMFLDKSVINDERKMAKIREYYDKIKDVPTIFSTSSISENGTSELPLKSKTSTSLTTSAVPPNKIIIKNKPKNLFKQNDNKNSRPSSSLSQHSLNTSSTYKASTNITKLVPRPTSAASPHLPFNYRPISVPPPILTPITKNLLRFDYANTPSGSRIPRIFSGRISNKNENK
ncbi:hypothetical protein Mgra_00001034 [Meloidogyne graminicola]|uniref:TOG domain-containing protein n=1 Tax=Meloidogyne graminicola TaxID=189291 RepID=A0A8T0A242_9BILA|nr:hypothetical protein Mgra_00001034 [Meloidogyne graminicola]